MSEPTKKKIKIESQKKISEDSETEISKSIKDSNNNSNISEEPEIELSNYDSWDPKSTCLGCREGQLNQLAHIHLGGCLYYPDSDIE